MLELREYLKKQITEYWENAWTDYRVTGKFLFTFEHENTLYIHWEEEGFTYTMFIKNIDQYTPEQAYNIWMESDWSFWAD